MPEGTASVVEDEKEPPALSVTEQRKERERQRRRERPLEAVAADAARAHAKYLQKVAGMTPADRDAARARARARYHARSHAERVYERESRRAAAATRAARASVSEQADDAERREARAEVFRRRRARLRDAAERELLSSEEARGFTLNMSSARWTGRLWTPFIRRAKSAWAGRGWGRRSVVSVSCLSLRPVLWSCRHRAGRWRPWLRGCGPLTT